MTYEEQLEIEDYLQEESVFVNGMTQKPAHQDSYMTIVDFARLKAAIEKADYDWAAFREKIESSPNIQPAMLVACSQMEGSS